MLWDLAHLWQDAWCGPEAFNTSYNSPIQRCAP